MDATILVIAAIQTTIHAVALSGLLSFYSAVVTKVVSAVHAAATTTAAIVSGLSFYSYAVAEIAIPAVN